MNRKKYAKIALAASAAFMTLLSFGNNRVDAVGSGNVSDDTMNISQGCALNDIYAYTDFYGNAVYSARSGLVSLPGTACSIQGYAFAKIKYVEGSGFSGETPLLMVAGNENSSLFLEPDCAEKSDSFFIFGSLKYFPSVNTTYYGSDNTYRDSSNYDYMIKSEGVSVGGINSPYADQWTAGLHYGNKTALYVLGNDSAGFATVRGNGDPLWTRPLNEQDDYIAANQWSKDHGTHGFNSANSPLKIYKKVGGSNVLVMYLSDILVPSGTGAGNENALIKDLGLQPGDPNLALLWGGGSYGYTAPGATNGSPVNGTVVGAKNPAGFTGLNKPSSYSDWNPYVITNSSTSSSDHDRDLYNELIKGYQLASYENGAPRTPRPGMCSWGVDSADPKVEFYDSETGTIVNENNGATKRATIILTPGQTKTIKFTHSLKRTDGGTNEITISGSAILNSTTKSFSGKVSGSTTSITTTTSTPSSPPINTSVEYCASTRSTSKSSGDICITVKTLPAVTEMSPTSTIRDSGGNRLNKTCGGQASDVGIGITEYLSCPLILPNDGKVVFATSYSVRKPNPYDATSEKYNASQVYPSTDTSIKFKIKHSFKTFVTDDSYRYDTYGNLYGNYGGNLRTRNLNWGYAKPGSNYSQYAIGALGLDVEWTNQGVTTNKITETLVTKDIKYGDLIRIKHNPSTAKYVFSLGSNKYEDGVKTTESGFDVYLYKQQANCNWYNYFITDPNTIVSYGIDSAHNYGGIRYKNYTTNRVAIADGNGVSQQTAWARPMDSINFGNYVCSGSNYAVENSAKLSGWANKKANYKLTTTTRNGGSSRVWTRKITAKNPASSGTDPSSILNEDGVYDTSVTTPKITSGSSLTCYGKGSNSTYIVTSGYANTSNRCNSISNMDLGGSFTETMTWKDYPIENYALTNVSGIDKSASVEVKVPYNYYIEPTVESSGSDDMIYPDGSAKKYNISINVKARKNDVVDNDEYATTTKHTKIQVITYKLDSSVANYTIDNKYSSLPSATYVKSGNILNTIRDNYNVNNNYTFVSQYELKGENSGETSRVFNKPSSSSTSTSAPDSVPDYAFSIVRNDGTGTSQNNSGYNNIAYDEGVEFNIGDKICVVVAAYPADSHNSIGANANDPNRFTLSGDYYQDAALNGDDGQSVQDGYWAISKPSCGSTGKRPNMSVESSWLYTTQSVKGIMTRRSAASRYYGSWAEYGILSTGNSKVNMFASSASIAYQPGVYPSNPNDRITSADGGGTESSTSIGTSMCSNTELLTISSDCNPDLYTNATNLKAKLESKINRSSTSLTSYLNSRFELGTISGLSGNYTYTGWDSGLAISNASSNVTYNAEANSAVLKSATGTITLDAGSGSDLNFNTGDVKTSIVYAKNVVINSNIIVSNNPMSSAGQAKAVIIVATGDIKIASNVTRIDAWLVSGGEINTCYKDNGRTITNVKDLALDVCNQTLVIDAPVYAKNIKLFRTAGGSGAVSGSGGMSSDEQMKRAEVFNFNTVNYFWAQTEIQSTETITTTDIKELPVRY